MESKLIHRDDWRPKDWKNIFDPEAVTAKDRYGKPVSLHDAYEAGATAIMRAYSAQQFVEDAETYCRDADWKEPD